MHADPLDPGELLDALRSYRGTITDLDDGLVVDGEARAAAREVTREALTAAGVSPGDRVVFAVGNGPRFAAAFGAVLEVGGAPLLLHFETPPAELRRAAETCAARFIVTDARPAEELRAASVEARPVGGGWLESLVCGVVDRAGEAAPYPRLVSVPLHPTSGTTGAPKIAVRPASAALAEARHYIAAIGIDAQDTVLATVPMSHAYGYGMCWMVPLLTGAPILTMRRLNLRAIQRAWRERRMTIFPTVPAVLDLLTRGAPQDLRGAGDIRVFSAGAPLAAATAASFAAVHGAPVRGLYGTTETGGISVVTAPTAVGLGVGPPMDGVKIDLRSIDLRGALADGAGRLHVSSSSMMAGYLERGAIDGSIVAGGWFDTGDLARLGADGSIELQGRESEVINVFGLKVLPGEVEEVLRGAKGVLDVAVYAEKHRSGSQIVKAAVVAAPGLEVAGLRAHCVEQLATYKCPQEFVFVAEIPRSSSGKILRTRLPLEGGTAR